MCGIVGFVLAAGERAEEAEVRRLADTLAHRGPDAAGALAHDNVALGHRRLSVIDPRAAADQPLGNEDGTVHVVFNGEIYNFQALTAELAARGHRFATRSDTEVLVHGWEEWGSGVVERLRGMFAFALYDRRRRRLLAARDRAGKKPFHYSSTPRGLVFGSEIKALLRHPAVSREWDPRAIGEFMIYGNAVGPRTAFASVRSLPPGCLLEVDTGAAVPRPEIRRYWRFTPRPDPRLDAGAWLEEVDAVLREAVRLRMIADVPLGAFLSGGVDSSLVVAQMARLAPGRVRTFCIGFEEAGWDESPWALAVAEHLGTEHTTEVVTPDAAAVLPELVECFDEPFADPSAIPTWYVSRMTRRGVTVALSGDGGDELFLGYRRYGETATLDRLGRWIGPPGRAVARGLGRLLPTGSYLGRGLDRVSRRGFDLYHHAMGWSPVYRSLLAPETARALGGAREQKAWEAFHRGEGLSLLDRCRQMDVEDYLPDQVLVKVDRTSMRHALEVRCPLLDQELMELAAKMPADAQVGPGEQKRLLRRLADRYVPRELLDRPKQGFAVPLARWFRGPLAAAMQTALADRASATWRFFDRAEAARRFAHHTAGRLDASTALWRLLFFHAWAEREER
jgi:asparagine synthase (glutamine-hydrolysing)